jgi:glycosyltransferase involved in cell wall biosynthesis
MLNWMEPTIAAIATCSAPVTTWQGRLPVVSLAPGFGKLASLLGAPTLFPGVGNRALRDLLEERRISAVVCHYMTCALQFSRVWESNPVSLFVHCHGYDVTWKLRTPRWPHFRRFSSGYVDKVRKLSQRCLLIANSEFTRARLEAAGISRERIAVKYLGVPVPDSFPPHVRTRSTDDVSILFLGRLVDFKGPGLTIRAFDHAARQGLKGTLTLAGDGPLRRHCERLRRRSPFADRIRLLGAVSARQGQVLLNSSDLFTAHHCTGAVSGQQEALGVSVLEAMAAGLPVAAGRSGGVIETVRDGETGMLFEPGDVPAHAAALLKLAQQPQLRQELGEAGWRRVREHFSVDQESQRLREILMPASDCQPRRFGAL